jgi:DNA-binding NarL/FixJ family response regulator
MDVSVDIGEGGGRASTRVLVVDDHDGFRTGLASILVAEGFTVDTAPSGKAALARATGFKPDVVLMDEHTPGMSGEEATRRVLRTIGSASVIMFGFHDDGMLEAVRGARGYLSKAATLEEILAVIAAAAHSNLEITAPIGTARSAHYDQAHTLAAPPARLSVPGEALAA